MNLFRWKVYIKFAVSADKRVFDDVTVVVSDYIEERVINRRLNDDIVAFFGESSYGVCKGKNNAGSFDEPLLFVGEIKALFKP